MQEKFNVLMLPHHTQMITLIMFAIRTCGVGPPSKLPKTMLARVGTGEGKSWIIGMLAAFVAKRGMQAHVIIDNDTLLERDYNMMSGMFTKLRINGEKRQFDKGGSVVYCSAIDVELFFLRTMQESDKAISMKGTVMIVDEVDSLIVDEHVYRCFVDE